MLIRRLAVFWTTATQNKHSGVHDYSSPGLKLPFTTEWHTQFKSQITKIINKGTAYRGLTLFIFPLLISVIPLPSKTVFNQTTNNLHSTHVLAAGRFLSKQNKYLINN